MVDITMEDYVFDSGRSLQQLPCQGCRPLNVVCAEPCIVRLDQVLKPEGQWNDPGGTRRSVRHIVQGCDGFTEDMSGFVVETCLTHRGQVPLPGRPTHEDRLVIDLVHISRGRTGPPYQDTPATALFGDPSHLEYDVSLTPETGN